MSADTETEGRVGTRRIRCFCLLFLVLDDSEWTNETHMSGRGGGGKDARIPRSCPYYVGVNSEQDFDDLSERRAVCFGVDKPRIELQMPTIVVRHEVTLGGNFGKVVGSPSGLFCPLCASLRNNG